jgi:hypothetical protein
MPSVANKPIISVITLNVIMLNVVVPDNTLAYYELASTDPKTSFIKLRRER